MSLKQKWVQHLEENCMSYFEHMCFALFYGGLCLLAAVYLFLHALLPCFFQTAGSDLVSMMAKKFKKQPATTDT